MQHKTTSTEARDSQHHHDHEHWPSLQRKETRMRPAPSFCCIVLFMKTNSKTFPLSPMADSRVIYPVRRPQHQKLSSPISQSGFPLLFLPLPPSLSPKMKDKVKRLFSTGILTSLRPTRENAEETPRHTHFQSPSLYRGKSSGTPVTPMPKSSLPPGLKYLPVNPSHLADPQAPKPTVGL